jgi:hypothetical protein
MKSKSAIVSSAFLFLIVAYCYNSCKPVWQFDHLEQNARNVVTGSELQEWATNFLAQHPFTNKGWNGIDLGTNFPQQLYKLAPRIGPRVYTYEGYDTNSPRWVGVHWGSGFLGASGFEIGPTNFHGFDPHGHEWQPGVYFYRRN